MMFYIEAKKVRLGFHIFFGSRFMVDSAVKLSLVLVQSYSQSQVQTKKNSA